MGNQWQRWDGRRVGGRGPRSFAPNVVPFRRRRVGPGLSGLVAVTGVALAAGLAGWVFTPESDSGWSNAPIEWNAVQDVPRAAPNPDDDAWAKRGMERAVADGDTGAGARTSVRASFHQCKWGGGTNCVVDGDTIHLDGQKIRIAGIDAPETHDYRCAEELALGNRATDRLQALLNGGAVTLTSIDRDEDRYGRKLRNVAVGGSDVGDTLVGEGLARWYAGGRRSWC